MGNASWSTKEEEVSETGFTFSQARNRLARSALFFASRPFSSDTTRCDAIRRLINKPVATEKSIRMSSASKVLRLIPLPPGH